MSGKTLMRVRVQSQEHLGFGISCCCEKCIHALQLWSSAWCLASFLRIFALFCFCCMISRMKNCNLHSVVFCKQTEAHQFHVSSHVSGDYFSIWVLYSTNQHGIYCNDYLTKSLWNLACIGTILCSVPNDRFLCVLAVGWRDIP